jgi:hypothetical protein
MNDMSWPIDISESSETIQSMKHGQSGGSLNALPNHGEVLLCHAAPSKSLSWIACCSITLRTADDVKAELKVGGTYQTGYEVRCLRPLARQG